MDPPRDAPPVHLELGLTWTPRPDASRLLGKGHPLAPQSWQPVPEKGQFDLGATLLAPGVLGEDVENHRGPIDRRATEDPLEVALLGRTEFVIEDDGVGVDRLAQHVQLFGLAASDVGRRVDRVAAPERHGPPHRHPRCR